MNYKEVVKFLKKYFKGEKKIIIISVILIIISSLIELGYGFIMGNVIFKASIGKYSTAIFLLVLLLVVMVIDELFLNRIRRILVRKATLNVMEKLTNDSFYKVGLLPAKAFEDKSSGEFINIITHDASTIADSFRHLLMIFVSLFSSIIVFIYIIFNSGIITLEIIIYLICFYLFSKHYLPIIKENEKRIIKEKDKAMLEVNESILGTREIRALGIRKKVNGNMKNIIRNIFYKSNEQSIEEANYTAVIMSLDNLLEGIVFITCIILLSFHKIDFVFFSAMTYYIYRFMNTVDNMMEFSTSFQKMRVAIDRIENIIDNKEYQDISFGSLHKRNIDGVIEFKNVSFKYHNEEKNLFNKLNLKIEKNQRVAIVGKSGQGKTSIFNLLLRYFDPDEGVILIDNIPIEDFDEESFNKNIAIIRQEPFLFNKSILDNFKIINEKLSLKKIREACKVAEIDDYIMSLKDKYNTVIGEGGVNLSGGQKQRIAIARALLKESKIILFDEATSALDNESQAKIKLAIDKLSKDHTIIMIAHRLSTIVDSDIIYLLDKGKIVDKGTHKELLSKNKIYQSLYQSK